MKKIAIIPARSGSKGLKDKNILKIKGVPLMAYSILAALNSKCFDRIIVSTDSIRYAEIAESYGAEVMMRGEELSNDTATSYMVIADVLSKIKDEYDYFVLLQPTSPLRTEEHIREAIDLFENHYESFDFLVSMKKAEFSSILVKPIESDLSLKHFDTDFANYRRQNYCEYSPNGAIFCGKPKEYLVNKHFFGARSIAYIMDEIDSVDIDNYIDYQLVNLIMSERDKK